MRRSHLTWLTALTLLAALTCAATANARPHKVEIGIGGTGFMNATFDGKLTDAQKTIDGPTANTKIPVPYPGFWGLAGGGGLTLNAMYRGFVGGELDLLYSMDTAKGEINNQKIEASQGAFHIPLLAKAAVPLRWVRPFLLIGPEFVIPGSPTVKSDISIYPDKGNVSPYINLATGFGFEFILPAEDGLDLRIPLSFRGSFNLGVDDTVAKRVRFGESLADGTPTIKSINTDWQYQAFIMLGFSWYQHVD